MKKDSREWNGNRSREMLCMCECVCVGKGGERTGAGLVVRGGKERGLHFVDRLIWKRNHQHDFYKEHFGCHGGPVLLRPAVIARRKLNENNTLPRINKGTSFPK